MIVHEGRVHKIDPPEVISAQMHFFEHCRASPKNVTRDHSSSLSYDFVQGRRAMPEDWHDIVVRCYDTIWRPGMLDEAEVLAYIEYAKRKARHPRCEFTEAFTNFDPELELTPSDLIHGDLTCDNVVVGHGITFIDPGVPRLQAVEQDVSKLQLSLRMQGTYADLGDHLTYDQATINWLEMCHWIRLLWHPEKFKIHYDCVVDIANERLGELLC